MRYSYTFPLTFQVSIAVTKTSFGDVDFNGTMFVDETNDNDWVIHIFICYLK